MTLLESLRFCDEVEKAATRKRKLTLFDFVAICEKFNRGFGKKTQQKSKNSDIQVQNQQSTTNEEQPQQETPQEIVVGGKTYPVIEYKAKGTHKNEALESEMPKEEGMTPYIKFKELLSSIGTVNVPVIGAVTVDADALIKHFEEKAKRLGKQGENEYKWRQIIVGYFKMTLLSPQEIWINSGDDRTNKLSYVLVKQFYNTNNGGSVVGIVIVDGDTMKVTTYYAEKENPLDLYERRWGYMIYPKKRD